jgi:hypothetical protein
MRARVGLQSLDGFYVGPVAAGVLLAYGIQLIVATLQTSIMALLVNALNFAIRIGGFGVAPFEYWGFSWLVISYTGVSGVVGLLIGLRFAAWVGVPKIQEPALPSQH